MNKLLAALRHPERAVLHLGRKYDFIPDAQYLRAYYKVELGKTLHLKSPKTYTEKLQWLKLYDHRPVYTEMVDKAAAKAFVAARIGEEYIIPTLGVYNSFDEIDFGALPNRFVIKCTHDSAGLVICRDKHTLDMEAARKKISGCLQRNFYKGGREWPYKNVKPRILVEQYMEDPADGELRDYKFFTFGGVPKILYITKGRGDGGETTADFFDMDFNHLDLRIDHEMAKEPPHAPKNFKKMQELAAVLSRDTPQLRVDFYEVDGKIYFGEMTFFHCSGFAAFRPASWDETLGSWVKLPEPRV